MSKKKKGGRRSIYEQWEIDGELDDILLKIEAMARDGLVQQQIADNIGISIETLILNKKKFPPFAEALKRGKQVVDTHVENALYKNAMGFEYKETKVIIEKDDAGKDRKRVEKTTKYALPNTTAQIFWLKNRKPDEWRDRRDLEHSGNISNEVVIEIDGEVID